MKIEHEPDISKNCSINATSPCDADCVIVYSIITVLPSELVPAIFGRDNTTINGPVLLLSSAVKVIAVFGFEVANIFSKLFTNSWALYLWYRPSGRVVPKIGPSRSQSWHATYSVRLLALAVQSSSRVRFPRPNNVSVRLSVLVRNGAGCSSSSWRMLPSRHLPFVPRSIPMSF